MVAANIPTSVYMRNKQLFGGGSEFIKYVVCPECHSLYKFEDCLEKRGSHYSVKTCSVSTFGKVCGTKLVKKLYLETETEGFTHTKSTLIPA